MQVLVRWVALVLVLVGCGPNRADAVAHLEALFPTLAAYSVTNFYITDECESIVYERGAFSTAPGTFECEIDIEGPQDRKPIDEQVRADLDAIYLESKSHGARIQAAYPEYGSDGSIVGGSFGFEVCTTYVYEPNWRELPEADSEEITAINASWWETSCAGLL